MDFVLLQDISGRTVIRCHLQSSVLWIDKISQAVGLGWHQAEDCSERSGCLGNIQLLVSWECYEFYSHSFWMTFWLYDQWWCICWHFWCDGFLFSIFWLKKTQLGQFFPWHHATMMILRSTLYLASTRSSMRSWWMPATIFSAIRNTWLTSRRLAFVLTTEICLKYIASQSWHGMSVWKVICTIFVHPSQWSPSSYSSLSIC